MIWRWRPGPDKDDTAERDDGPAIGADPHEPVGQLPPQPWMEAPETQAVIAALGAEGGEVRFVGGCVRDAVLKRPVQDIDIATLDPPERVIALLEAQGIRAIPTGIAHGTVTAVVGGAHFEITTLRRDVETFGRHARVAFTDDWAADAARRDLTINALSCRPDGAIFDPFHGLDDLRDARVRFVGKAMDRVREDVLRLLRFFRFYAWYGAPPMDGQALAAARAFAPELARLSGERVSGELFKLLKAPDPASVLLIMHDEHVLEHFLPEARDLGRLRALCWLETRAIRAEGVTTDPLRRLAAVLRTDHAGGLAVAERLKLSNHQRDRLVAMAAPPRDVRVEDDARARRRHLRHLGPLAFQDAVLLTWSGDIAAQGRLPRARTEGYLALLEQGRTWRPVVFPLKGRDALDFGVKPGPAVGRLLAEVERWWEDQDYRPGHEDCLARLGGLLLLQGEGQSE